MSRIVIHGTKAMRTLWQTFVVTPAMKAAVDPSIAQPSNNFYLCNKINKCIHIKYVSPNVINYQDVSIAFTIIIGEPLSVIINVSNIQ